ncbi:hypothetical protein TIFTF001_036567 [Ficus carica]|uniref:Uncharacterized protein n=1 Tax=Ficus carica TaxID=3494 RepID=A0AA88JCV9_FICCA|nr:hypothetical protein TIFTF001_036567 [Ficus carica]
MSIPHFTVAVPSFHSIASSIVGRLLTYSMNISNELMPRNTKGLNKILVQDLVEEPVGGSQGKERKVLGSKLEKSIPNPRGRKMNSKPKNCQVRVDPDQFYGKPILRPLEAELGSNLQLQSELKQQNLEHSIPGNLIPRTVRALQTLALSGSCALLVRSLQFKWWAMRTMRRVKSGVGYHYA